MLGEVFCSSVEDKNLKRNTEDGGLASAVPEGSLGVKTFIWANAHSESSLA